MIRQIRDDLGGRIFYIKNRGLPGVGFESTKWKEVKDISSATDEQVIEDNTYPGGPVSVSVFWRRTVNR